MLIKTNFSNINSGMLIFLIIWYVIWVPMCLFVSYSIYIGELNYFGYIWMVFGLVGLIAVPISLLDIFTSYEFLKSKDNYVIKINSIFNKKTIFIPEGKFIGIYFGDNEESNKTIFIEYIDKHDKLIREQILIWIKYDFQISILNELKWKSAQQGDAPETGSSE